MPRLPNTSQNDNNKKAQLIWEQSVGTHRTPVEAYLWTRGIQPPLSEALRFYDDLIYWDSENKRELKFPAMVAGISRWPDEKIIDVQRTWLKSDGSGKAPVEPNKMTLGSMGGAAVQLAPPGHVLGLAEGVETALTIMQEHKVPTWATLGAGNFATVKLPPLPLAEAVYIYADGDAISRDYAREASDLFTRQGRAVWIYSAPDGVDFNDLLIAYIKRTVENGK